MKRSEMIKKMTELLKSWENCAITDKTSKKLLAMMEDHGMLPPFCSEVYYKTWRDGGEGYEWEKE